MSNSYKFKKMNKKLLIADSEDEDSEIEFSEGSDYKDD